MRIGWLLLLAACGATPAPSSSTPPSSAETLLHELNRQARAGAVTESIHGRSVDDPYRLLETESDLTRRWIDAQSERSRAALPIDPERRARLAALLRIGNITRVRVGGSRVFFQLREGEREQPILLVRVGERDVTLLDPITFGERAALDWYYPSPDGSRIAFGISSDGDERSTLRVLDVEARIEDAEAGLLPLRIPRAKWSTVSWLPDASGFYYTRYPKPDEEGFDPANEDAYFPRIFFHALGSDPEADPRVFGASEGTEFPTPSVSTDGRSVVINVFRGWSASDVYVFERRSGQGGPDDAHPLLPVFTGEDAVLHGSIHEGTLYALTDLDAPRRRVLGIPLETASDRSSWRELIAESDATLESMTLSGDGIAAHYVADVASELVLFDRDGTRRENVPLPTRGELSDLDGQPGSSTLAFAFSGYLQPPSVMRVDDSGHPAEVRRVECEIDFEAFTIRQERIPSADGTEVPVYLIHRRDIAQDGNAPVLLYGYGGFNISLLPGFSRSVMYWVERGGVYAVANLRGGGEFGEAWHRAGMLENKPHVFEDFEAVLGWLHESGLSRPERIAITGGSNGGLLMGSMITRVPERFAAAAAYVGLFDMVRYHHFPPAELWISEYGTSDDPEQLGFLLGYSPYHQVRAGTRYPSVLIETADHDSRVHWAHSTKFAAALQEATSADAPIYFYMQRSQGHGAGARLSDTVDKYARLYAFVESALGLARRN